MTIVFKVRFYKATELCQDSTLLFALAAIEAILQTIYFAW